MLRSWKYLFLVAGVIAAHGSSRASAQMQFDIICKNHGRKVIDNKADLNQSEGDNAPWRWQDTFRYAIDLKGKRYRGLAWVDQSPSKIVRVTKTRIWFSEDRDGFARYNLISNRYYARGHGATFLIHVVTGQCRRAKFSGINVNPRPVPHG